MAHKRLAAAVLAALVLGACGSDAVEAPSNEALVASSLANPPGCAMEKKDQDCLDWIMSIEGQCHRSVTCVRHADSTGSPVDRCVVGSALPQQSCFDGSLCTTDDTCTGVKCVGKVVNCDDNNTCTNDSCDAKTGCQYSAQSGVLCTDGDACTVGDKCTTGGKCAGDKPDCEDKNPCTTDSCDKVKGCVSVPNANACDDGNVCTEGDVCSAGACAAGKAKTCNDNNVCTDDSCDAAVGCKFGAKADALKVACSDKDPTTADDVCVGGKCIGKAYWQCDADADCVKMAGTLCGEPYCAAGTCKVKFDPSIYEDGNPCTLDGCDPDTGPTHVPQIGVTCNDNNACTEFDSCTSEKSCKGAAKKCDDGNACTENKCDAVSGCLFPKLDASSISDKKWSTKDSCDPIAGMIHTPSSFKFEGAVPVDMQQQFVPVPVLTFYVKLVGGAGYGKVVKPTVNASSYSILAEELCPTYLSGMSTPLQLTVHAYGGNEYVVMGGEWGSIFDENGKKLATSALPISAFMPDGSPQPQDHKSVELEQRCKELMASQ